MIIKFIVTHAVFIVYRYMWRFVFWDDRNTDIELYVIVYLLVQQFTSLQYTYVNCSVVKNKKVRKKILLVLLLVAAITGMIDF